MSGDFEVKTGQIAHVDHDPSNSRVGNLVFLCLEHHEAYDSRTSQSKGVTQEEVRLYRNILHADVSTQLPRLEEEPEKMYPRESLSFHEMLKSLRSSELHASCLLNDSEIESAIEAKFLRIDPFNRDNLHAASYSLCLGQQAVVGHSLREIGSGKPLVLTKGDVAVVPTREFLALPPDLVGRLIEHGPLGGRIFVSGSGHVDPGYMGRLILLIENRGLRDTEIEAMTRIASIEFMLLSPWSSRRYRGKLPGNGGLAPFFEGIA